jgi:hypothetical protein
MNHGAVAPPNPPLSTPTKTDLPAMKQAHRRRATNTHAIAKTANATLRRE